MKMFQYYVLNVTLNTIHNPSNKQNADDKKLLHILKVKTRYRWPKMNEFKGDMPSFLQCHVGGQTIVWKV